MTAKPIKFRSGPHLKPNPAQRTGIKPIRRIDTAGRSAAFLEIIKNLKSFNTCGAKGACGVNVAKKPRGARTQTFSRRLFILITVAPGFAYYCLTIIAPNILALLLSLHKWGGLSWSFKWTGLDNFRRLFKDQIFYKALANNLYMAVATILLTLVVSLFMAAVLSNKSIKRVGFFRSIFYFPNVMSVVVTSMLWKFMYDPQLGIINAALRSVGLESLAMIWLGNTRTVKPALVVSQLWGSVGLYILIYMTTMRSVNPSLYEAAEMDGAGKARQFFSVTLPIIAPTVKTALIYSMAGALNGGFAAVRIMTGGGPNRESTVLTSYLYEKAFIQGDYGYGAAIGVFVLAVGFALYFLIDKFLRGEAYET
jgi:N-acetylglucosamine transport system permease protein